MTTTGRRKKGRAGGRVGASADHLLALGFLRLGLAAGVLVVPVLAGRWDDALPGIAAAELAVAAGAEMARRLRPDRSPAVLAWSTLVDASAVAVAAALTGGFGSPLLFLVLLDVVAVALVASYRRGLAVATWSALLLLVGHAVIEGGIVEAPHDGADRVALVGAASLLVFAAVTARFSSMGERTLELSRDQLASLVDLGAELERARRPDDVLGALARHACARLGFRRVLVLVRRDGEWVGVRDDGRATTLVESRTPVGDLVAETWRAASPVLVRSLDDPLLDMLLPDASNVAVTPIAVDGEDLGVAVGEWGGRTDARIPAATVHAFAEAAQHAALSLRNAELLAEVERLATRDSLTGLANRRLFDESLRRETARALRLATPLSLVVVDVDHFKQVNDTFGHPVGDDVLRQVADALVANTKGFDLAARYGGDEFVILLPDCRREDALGVAERVRTQILREVAAAPVTISVGVAAIPDNALDAERLLAAADSALYEAKRTGRDRVTASGRAPVVIRRTA